jgi:hypothetical protein
MAALGGGEFQTPKVTSGAGRGPAGDKTLGDEFDDAGVIEVVPESIVESLEQRGILRIALEGLKSGTARRTLSTPRPEPVRTQS